MTHDTQADLTLPTVPTWVKRACSVLILGTVLALAPVSAATPQAGGSEHHVFNPGASIDRSQIEVRP